MKYNSQRDATFDVVSQVLKNHKIEFVPGKTDARPHFERKSPLRAEAIGMLVAIFTHGDAPLSKEAKAQTDLNKYCSGLLNNWLRKDSDFNGGAEYVPKVGAGDEMIKNLKLLLATKPEAADVINAEIQKRQAQIAAEKAKSKVKEIDVSKLPEHLRKLVG